MIRLKDVVVDCRHAASLARFWAAVLDGYAVAPYDRTELDRLAGLGIMSAEDDPTVLVEGGPDEVRFFFQVVPEVKTVKNRWHVDLQVDDLHDSAILITSLGGTIVAVFDDHLVMGDPEGNEFCLTR